MATIHLVGRDCVVLLVRRYVCRSDPFPSDLAASFRFSCSSSPSVNKLVHPKRSWNVPTWPPPNGPQRWCFNRNPLRPKFPVAARSVWMNGSDNWTMMAIDWSQDNSTRWLSVNGTRWLHRLQRPLWHWLATGYAVRTVPRAQFACLARPNISLVAAQENWQCVKFPRIFFLFQMNQSRKFF